MMWGIKRRLELYMFCAENLWVAPLVGHVIAAEVILIVIIYISFSKRKSEIN